MILGVNEVCFMIRISISMPLTCNFKRMLISFLYPKLFGFPPVICTRIACAVGKCERTGICCSVIFILGVHNIAVRIFIAVENQSAACNVIPIDVENLLKILAFSACIKINEALFTLTTTMTLWEKN